MKQKLKKVQRKLKKIQAKNSKLQAKKGPAKKGTTTKFNVRDPGAYISASEWKKLTPDQQKAARDARAKKGIPVRQVSAISTTTSDVEMIDVDDDRKPAAVEPVPMVVDQSAAPATVAAVRGTRLASVPPHLLRAPSYKPVATTQRAAMYGVRSQAQQAARAVVQEQDRARKAAALSSSQS